MIGPLDAEIVAGLAVYVVLLGLALWFTRRRPGEPRIDLDDIARRVQRYRETERPRR